MRPRDGARYDATSLLAFVLGRDAAWLLAHGDAPLSGVERARFEAAIARRARGEPVPYITGVAGFFGRTFAVDASVLVPRPETEDAVALALAATAAVAAPHYCDVGTGSGAIALTLALERPDATVTAIDVSPAALAIARRNARALGAEARVRFVLGDGLAAAPPAARFACIVANLPYVRTNDLARAPDPTSFEPRLALDGGADGLDAYRALVRDAVARGDDGTLVMEGGPDTARALADLAAGAFADARVETVRDLAGLERLVVVRRERRAPSENDVVP